MMAEKNRIPFFHTVSSSNFKYEIEKFNVTAPHLPQLWRGVYFAHFDMPQNISAFRFSFTSYFVLIFILFKYNALRSCVTLFLVKNLASSVLPLCIFKFNFGV